MAARRKPLGKATKPTDKGIDDFVNQTPEKEKAIASPTTEKVEKVKRLTIDVHESLHKKLKMKSVEEGETMAKLVRRWIEEKL